MGSMLLVLAVCAFVAFQYGFLGEMLKRQTLDDTLPVCWIRRLGKQFQIDYHLPNRQAHGMAPDQTCEEFASTLPIFGAGLEPNIKSEQDTT